MAATTQWIMDIMEAWAPAEWAAETDNVGLLVGDRARPVVRVLTALDLSEEVLREALRGRFDFIITHHPLISRHSQPINSITTDNALGKKIMTLIANGIGLFSAHTNLDAAPGGVNDLLFNLLGLIEKDALVPAEDSSFPTLGLIGYLPQPMTLENMAKHIRDVLSSDAVRYVGLPERMIHKVGICGGNGTSSLLVKAAFEKKCDVYITGDVGYHLAMEALESDMAVIDATHYATEIPIAQVIAEHIKKSAENHGFELTVQAAQSSRQVFKTLS